MKAGERVKRLREELALLRTTLELTEQERDEARAELANAAVEWGERWPAGDVVTADDREQAQRWVNVNGPDHKVEVAPINAALTELGCPDVLTALNELKQLRENHAHAVQSARASERKRIADRLRVWSKANEAAGRAGDAVTLSTAAWEVGRLTDESVAKEGTDRG